MKLGKFPRNLPSDHRHTVSNLDGSVPVLLVRNLRSTNWDSFRKDLKGRFEQGLETNMKDEARLGLTILYVLLALTLA